MSKAKKRGLKRGLSALLEDDNVSLAAVGVGNDASAGAVMDTGQALAAGAQEVPIEQLRPNSYQPRRIFDAEELSSLAESIRVKGVLMPILVRANDNGESAYEIIAGERRWRAAQLAKLHQVPVLVKELDDTEALEIAIIENIQRQDLNPLEEAQAYQRLMEEFSYTQAEAAEAVGKSRPHVANSLRLLVLPQNVQAMLDEGKLTAGHARALVTARDPYALAQTIIAKGLNVRQAEKLARQSDLQQKEAAGQPKSLTGSEDGKDADIRAVERDLSERLGLRVAIDHRGEKGELRIWYSSLEQFDEVLDRLKRGY